MARQDKISSNFAGWQRKINDYKVSQSGIESEVIRLKIVEDIYGDASEWNIITHDKIIVSLVYPGDLPLTRLRTDLTQEVPSTENVFIYDILPIEGVSQFQDNIERDDILVHKIHTDINNDDYYIVLKVSETTGNITHKHLTKKSFQCAPFNGALPQKVQDIIDSYIDEESNI